MQSLTGFLQYSPTVWGLFVYNFSVDLLGTKFRISSAQPVGPCHLSLPSPATVQFCSFGASSEDFFCISFRFTLAAYALDQNWPVKLQHCINDTQAEADRCCSRSWKGNYGSSALSACWVSVSLYVSAYVSSLPCKLQLIELIVFNGLIFWDIQGGRWWRFILRTYEPNDIRETHWGWAKPFKNWGYVSGEDDSQHVSDSDTSILNDS